jgi:perosamine synthetase
VGRHSWQSFVTFVDENLCPLPTQRNDATARCRWDRGTPRDPCGAQPWPLPRALWLPAGGLPGALACAEQSMAIPLQNRMTAEDFERVAASLEAL